MTITTSLGTESGSVRSNTLYVGYLCSHCRNPVIEIVNIHAKAQGKTSGFGKVSEEELNKQSASIIEEAVAAMRLFLQNPTANTYPNNMEKRVSYHGWNVPCPVCGELEPWQDVNSLQEQPASFGITIFPTLENAYEWARTVLLNRKREAETVLSTPEELDKLNRSEQEVLAEQKRNQDEIENGAIALHASQLKKKKEQILKELKELGVFSKERKRIQEELKGCEEALRIAESKQKSERIRLEAEIARAEIKRNDFRLLRVKYADGGVLFKTEESIALRLLEQGEASDAGYVISLQQLPTYTSFQISSFEENKDALKEALAKQFSDLLR